MPIANAVDVDNETGSIRIAAASLSELAGLVQITSEAFSFNRF